MDPTLWTNGDWAVFTSSLPRVAALAGLGMLVGLAVALVLTALFAPPEDAGERDDRRPAEVPPAVAAAVAATPAPVAALAVGSTAAIHGTALLHGAAMSPTDVIALTALRRRIQAGEVADGPTGAERLAFARWLVEHGRLGG